MIARSARIAYISYSNIIYAKVVAVPISAHLTFYFVILYIVVQRYSPEKQKFCILTLSFDPFAMHACMHQIFVQNRKMSGEFENPFTRTPKI